MKLKYMLAAGMMAAMTTGCNESSFLDLKPQGALNEDLLNSKEGIELLITSAYSALQGPNRDMMWVPMTNWTYGEVRSDNAYKGGSSITDGGDINQMETFVIDATWGNADSKWYQLYCCLQRANEALRILNTMSEADMPELTVRKAEMKVIRAHFYFELCRLFKQIPYLDETIDQETYKNIPNNQFSREEILDKIATDLLEAAKILPPRQSEIGRINQYIAYAYAAKVRLYQAYKQDERNQVVSIDKDLLREVVELCNRLDGQYDLLEYFYMFPDLSFHPDKVFV
jgi:starch-binding outer membrane protein, SusD/RagB family